MSKPTTKVREWLLERYPDDGLTLLEPAEYDAAIVGVADRVGLFPAVVYDRRKLVPIAMRLFECDYEMALDHVGFNVTGFTDGPTSPLFIDTYRPGHDATCDEEECPGDAYPCEPTP